MSTPDDTNEPDEKVEETAPTEEPVAEEAVAEEAPVEEAPAPKPRRSRAKKPAAEEAVAEETPVEEAPAPKRRRSRANRQPEPAPARARSRNGVDPDRPVVRAQARYVRTSARKARLVCDLLRGKSVQEARAILAYSQRSVARDWAKVLESAIANAEHNHELVGDDLRILTASADEGPTLKRFRPRAMGRATRIRKRTSHLTITLTPKE
jgi:ribosomal protein L22